MMGCNLVIIEHVLKIIETELSEPLKSISGDDISQFYKICNFSSLRYVVLPVDLLGTSGTGLSATEPFRTLSRAFLKICLKKKMTLNLFCSDIKSNETNVLVCLNNLNL